MTQREAEPQPQTISAARQVRYRCSEPVLPHQRRPEVLRSCGGGLASGHSVAWFEFLTGVDEIFDVQAISGYGKIILRGPHLKEDEEQELWIVPSPAPV